MRRVLIYISLLFAAAGCTMDHKTEYDPLMELVFHPVLQNETKAEDSGQYLERDSFTVNAWMIDREYGWSDKNAEVETYFETKDVTYKEGRWKLEDEVYWPSREKRLNIIAYSPVDAFTSCSITDGVTATYDILENQADILYTDPQTDLDKVECGGVVVLPFQNALSKVDFEVKNRVNKGEEIIIKSIYIDQVHTAGTFRSIPDPQWTIENQVGTITIYQGERKTKNIPEKIGYTWNIIPQTLKTNISVEYEYKTASNTGFTLTLKTCEMQTVLKPGRHYTYTLSVGIDDVKFLTEIIEDRIR